MANPDIELRIDDIAFGGKGVGRAGGKAVFVPFVVPGERVTVKIRREKRRFAEAELVEVLETSLDRVTPSCPYFGRCGGCSYQHIGYERQLALKHRQVEETLRRLGGIPEPPMRAIIASRDRYGYRNRIRVHAAGGVIGFYTWDNSTILDIDRCAIASREVNEGLARLRQRPLRDGDYTIAENDLGRFFEQTNPGAGTALRELVGELISPGSRCLVDAYCGAGAFGGYLAGRFDRVIGIEENGFAVAHARRNATKVEEYIEGPVEAHLVGVLKECGSESTTLLLDPPAAGLAPRVIDAVLAGVPADLVYVSCNPATLARDLGRLSPVYGVESVTPLDMFPQTAEIEVVVHMRRKVECLQLGRSGS